MGFLDRLLGREEQPQDRYTPPAGYDQPGYQPAAGAPAGQTAGQGTSGAPRSEDEIAVERYRYLLRTAPPETIEQVHEEAFTKLTPEQRKLLFQQLTENAPAGEAPRGDDPRSLAQSATRSELRQPGTLERSLGQRGSAFGGGGGGMGFGGMFASSLLGSVAGYVIGSALVSAFLPGPGDMQADQGDQSGADQGDQGDQSGADQGDPGAGDAGAGDVNADGGWGDSGGDFGGGDFGGGDFGGGDFGGGFDF